MRFLALFYLVCFPLILNAQYGYEPNHKNVKLSGWDKSKEFKKEDVKAVNVEFLIDKYQNKTVTPVYVSKEFREFSYKNFYRDQNLKRIIKDKSYKGLRSHASNGSGGTMVLYKPQNNYRLLFGKRFVVKGIKLIINKRHLANTDDTNYVFTLVSDEFGEIYYEYNSKFESDVEIELF